MTSSFRKRVSYLYLILTPVMASVFGFGVGHVSYLIYLPVWLLHACLMIYACRTLGLTFGISDEHSRQVFNGLFLLIVPWILISMFAGLGPPPETEQGWVDTALEQQIRYFMLVIAGISLVMGFSLLASAQARMKSVTLSTVALAGLYVAIPLFVLNMIFWGFYLPEYFQKHMASGSAVEPDWFHSLRKWFGMISVVEVALTYLSTAFFSWSFFRCGWMTRTGARLYVIFSIVGFLIIVLSAFLGEPFITAGFIVSIPATPFLMPYLMGVNMIRRSAGSKNNDEQ